MHTVTRLAAAAALAAVVGLGCASDADQAAPGPLAERAAATTTEPPETTTTTEATPPEPADYTVALFTQRQQCFGSAGCNVTVVPEVTMHDATVVGVPVSITFEVSGDDSGPVIVTVALSATGNYTQRPIILSTSGADVVPAATVTAVR